MLQYQDSFFQSYDVVFSIASIIGSLLIIVYSVSIIKVIIDIKRGRRIRSKQFGIEQFITGIFMYIYTMVCTYYLPYIMFSRITWKAVLKWGSEVIVLGTIAVLRDFHCFTLIF